MTTDFRYAGERFADIQMLRYRLNSFEKLSSQQKKYIYYLSKATLYGRDITFDQFGAYNLRIRKVLEAIYTDQTIDHTSTQFQQLEIYLKRVWFSNGIHHHYGCIKFVPNFTPEFLHECMLNVDSTRLPLRSGQTVEALFEEICPVIFDPDVLPKRVNKADGEDLVQTSACHFYENVTQQEAENFYEELKQMAASDPEPLSFGLNSTLTKTTDGKVTEVPWCMTGRYAKAISQIVYWLEEAKNVAENEQQKEIIDQLVKYYETGNLRFFNARNGSVVLRERLISSTDLLRSMEIRWD